MNLKIIALLPLQYRSCSLCPRDDLPSASPQANAVLKLRVFIIPPQKSMIFTVAGLKLYNRGILQTLEGPRAAKGD